MTDGGARYELLQAAEVAHAEDLTLRFHPVAWGDGFYAGLDAQAARIAALTEAIQADLAFYEWYLSADAEDVVRNVQSRRAEIVERLRAVLDAVRDG